MRGWDDPAGGKVGDSSEAVAGTEGRGGAARRANNGVPQVRQDLVGRDGCAWGLPVVQCPLLRGPEDLSQVVDAEIGLRRGACPDPTGHGDRGQQTNKGDNNHDFHECESLAPHFSGLHYYFAFLPYGVNLATGGEYDCELGPRIACCRRTGVIEARINPIS